VSVLWILSPIAGCNPVAINKWGGGKWFDSIKIHQIWAGSDTGVHGALAMLRLEFDPPPVHQISSCSSMVEQSADNR